MTIWILLGAMAVAATGFVLLPLFRSRSGEATGRPDHDRRVYLDQLEEIERETREGLIAPDAAESARAEIARRLLALEAAEDGESSQTDGPATFTRLYLMVAIPAAAAGLYLMVGSPHLPDQPAADRPQLADQGGESAALIAQLGEKLKNRPEDLTGWRLYARGLYGLHRFEEAAAAYRHAASLAPRDAKLRAALAESLIQAADGIVTREARAALAGTLSIDPGNARARYYAGLAASQAGDIDRALMTWISLLADSEPDTPLTDLLNKRIEKLARDAGISAERLSAMRENRTENAPQRGPTKEDVEAAREMSAEDRAEMINAMVARLAARMAENPDNAEGWIRLARSYGVLEQHDKARDAWARAAALKPGDAETLSAYAAAIARTTPDGAPLPQALIETSEKLLKLNPDHGGALWFAGLASAAAGDYAAARTRWDRLLTTLDPASPQFAEIKRRLEALPDKSGK